MAGQRQRQARLESLLNDLGHRPGATRQPPPRLETMPADASERVLASYRELGGLASAETALRPGPWDIVLADGLRVELDEEQHFNRYRLTTLGAAWAFPLPWAADFRRYSVEHEDACLRKARRGGYWTSPSTERMFGPAGSPGELGGHGSPRWKQRALYDAMRDVLAASAVVRIARVAVWDELDGVPVGRMLDGRAPIDLEGLAELVDSRDSGHAS